MSNQNGKVTAYPKRPKFFAHRYCRLLTKAAVAQRIGPEACWLLAVVVHQEDAVTYSRPVDFYNEQLMALCGFGGRSRLVTARKRAIDAGWLNYIEGGKARPGTYWVQVPDGYQDITDGPCDESFSRPESGQQTEDPPNNGVPKQDGNRTANGRQPDGKPSPSNPFPNPSPSPKKSASADAVPEGLLELIDGWNSLPDGMVKTGNGARRDPPAKASLKSWNRSQKEPELREAFRDIPALLKAIERAKFCHGQPWFTVPWLFGTNKNDEFNAVKILNGGHDGSGNGRSPQQDSPARIRDRDFSDR